MLPRAGQAPMPSGLTQSVTQPVEAGGQVLPRSGQAPPGPGPTASVMGTAGQLVAQPGDLGQRSAASGRSWPSQEGLETRGTAPTSRDVGLRPPPGYSVDSLGVGVEGLVTNWEERQLQAALLLQAQAQLSAPTPTGPRVAPEALGAQRNSGVPTLPVATESGTSEVSARSRLSSPLGELRTGSHVEVLLNGVVCQAQVNAQGKIEVVSVQTSEDLPPVPKHKVEHGLQGGGSAVPPCLPSELQGSFSRCVVWTEVSAEACQQSAGHSSKARRKDVFPVAGCPVYTSTCSESWSTARDPRRHARALGRPATGGNASQVSLQRFTSG